MAATLMEADLLDGDLGAVDSFGLTPTSYSAAQSYSSMDSEHDPSEQTYTIEEAIEKLGFGPFQFRVAAIAGFVWTADAMEMMVLSILSPALQCDWGLSKWLVGLVTSLVFVGMTAGSAIWGSLSDRYGRRIVLVLAASICLYYGILSALATSLVWLLIFRCLVGFGVSGGAQAVTMYSEFLPRKFRAKSIVAMEAFFAIGTVFEVALAYFVMPIMGWRWLLIFSSVPLLLFIVSCWWLPESMRYNVTKGHIDQAEQTLKECAKVNGKSLPPGRLVGPKVQEPRGSLSDLYSPALRRTTMLLWFIWFANTFCYYGVVLVTTELLEIQGEKVCTTIASGHLEKVECALDCEPLEQRNYLELLWTTFAEFPGLIITFFIIDLIGRKYSSAALFGAFSLFTGLVALCKGRIFMIVCLFMTRCFISGAFQVAFVYAPEVYPTKCRALGLGMCSSVARIGAIVTPFVAQVLLEHSIYAVLGIYTTVGLLAALASLLLPIETKGRELDTSHIPQ